MLLVLNSSPTRGFDSSRFISYPRATLGLEWNIGFISSTIGGSIGAINGYFGVVNWSTCFLTENSGFFFWMELLGSSYS